MYKNAWEAVAESAAKVAAESAADRQISCSDPHPAGSCGTEPKKNVADAKLVEYLAKRRRFSIVFTGYLSVGSCVFGSFTGDIAGSYVFKSLYKLNKRMAVFSIDYRLSTMVLLELVYLYEIGKKDMPRKREDAK